MLFVHVNAVPSNEYNDLVFKYDHDIEQLQSQIVKYKNAIVDYSEHLSWCRGNDEFCTCGLNKLMDECSTSSTDSTNTTNSVCTD